MNMTIKSTLQKILSYDEDMRYKLLARMQADCKYYLATGSNPKYLWSDNEAEQIANMKALYNSFQDSDKPLFITKEEILLYEKLMLRRVDITKEDVRCIDLIYEDDMKITSSFELWFNVDKYFGTSTRNDDSTWINFYTEYMPDTELTAKYFVETDDSSEEFEWPLNYEEREFLEQKMNDYCVKVNGCDLRTAWKNHYKEK